MSWKDLITSKKNTLFTITIGITVDDDDLLWVRETPNVWKATWSWNSGLKSFPTYGVGPWGFGLWGKSGDSEVEEPENNTLHGAGSFEVDGSDYLQVYSIDDCDSTLESFYFNTSNQIIYVHYDGYFPNTDIKKKIGELFGFSLNAEIVNGVYYEPLISSIPDLSIARDDLFDNIAKYGGGSVACDNKSGYFNYFNSKDIYGKRCQLLVGESGSGEYEAVFTGFIRDFNIVGTEATFTLKDERLNLERKIGRNYLSQDDYPFMESDGGLIPITYGRINRGPAICLNQEDESATVYVFKFSDTTLHSVHSIDQVYVEDVKKEHQNVDLVNGTFELTSSVYEDGNKVSVSFSGYVDDDDELIENGLDIIKDLLLIYDDRTYNSNNFNIENWEAQTLEAPDCNVYLGKTKTLIKTITTILSGFGGTFKVQGDGRFSIKKVDFNKDIVKTIYSDEMLEDIDENNDADGYVTSVRVGYAQDYSQSEYSYYNNDDYEEELYLKNKSYSEQDFESYLTDKADALSYSNTIMGIYGGIFTEFTFKTMIQNMDLELEDNINIYDEKDLNNKRLYKVEIISIKTNLTSFEIEFCGRFIEELEIVEPVYVNPYLDYIDTFPLEELTYTIEPGNDREMALGDDYILGDLT